MRRLAILLTLLSSSALAQQAGSVGGRVVEPAGQTLPEPNAANVRVPGMILEPRAMRPDAATVAKLEVPRGFKVEMFAQGLGNARLLAVADDGTVYLTRRAEGDVVMLRDANDDGRADVQRTVARRPGMHGIAISGRTVYLVAQKEVLKAPILPDGSLGPLELLAGDLPDAGQHSARSIAIGPDGMLYLGVGSTCNACTETSPESATVLRMTPDGKSRTIYASGLRHTVGFDWQPRSGALYGMDHGIDWLGDEQQPEELNRIELGKPYGWPYIYGMGGENPQDDPPNDLTMAELNQAATRPVLGYTAHAAPMQLAFYRGAMFPGAYQGDAFVTFRGSWNRSKPSGYEVARLRFDASGAPTAFEPFLRGFLQTGANGPSQSGRPVGLAVAKDGALLFTDDINGVIYRVSYTGGDRAGTMLEPVARRAPEMEARPKGFALAKARDETRTATPLSLSSSSFIANRPISLKYSAYGEDQSPALRWTAPPAGATHLAILMEDPDAVSGHPFVHWTAWNIPASLGALPEGLPKELQLNDPKGIRQGRNTRGSIGYYGPRPPIGDRPHDYHFQAFALSGPLDLQVGATREQLLNAMAGKVVASGEIIGTYAQSAPPQKR
ncbi:YbhB/YbcL family Raf kinase inhibitor-like protein [Novosphingobium sp. PS1R-30]|uniref:YbhB/YbcL family Raf kinase inhibitor-like protein n=1 Tax=Novosphingobium anseongense TaxID=3133436 RepID=A0ABU8RUA2_9SPHN